MSGTIPLSLTQQLDEFAKPLNGGKLYIIQAGTVSTPQNSYQDPALTIALPNPITLDAAGRLPQFFLADGFIKIRLTNSAGVVQREADAIQVIGPSAGGGGGGSTVDPNALIQTGNMIMRYGVGALGGYVRMNGLTFGSATSGGSERANADCQACWIYLYGADANLVVSGGRTGNALNDWTANKTMALPDWRGYAVGALDDMGNAPSGRLSASFFGSSAIVLGAVGGGESNSLSAQNLAAHIHNVYPYDPGHFHQSSGIPFYANNQTSWGGGVNQAAVGGVTTYSTDTRAANIGVRDAPGGGGTANQTTATGSGTPFRTIGPRKLCTFYLKL